MENFKWERSVDRSLITDRKMEKEETFTIFLMTIGPFLGHLTAVLIIAPNIPKWYEVIPIGYIIYQRCFEMFELF